MDPSKSETMGGVVITHILLAVTHSQRRNSVRFPVRETEIGPVSTTVSEGPAHFPTAKKKSRPSNYLFHLSPRELEVKACR